LSVVFFFFFFFFEINVIQNRQTSINNAGSKKRETQQAEGQWGGGKG